MDFKTKVAFVLLSEAEKSDPPPDTGARPAYEKQTTTGEAQWTRSAELTKKEKEAEESGSFIHRLHGKSLGKVAKRLFNVGTKNFIKAARTSKLLPRKRR